MLCMPYFWKHNPVVSWLGTAVDISHGAIVRSGIRKVMSKRHSILFTFTVQLMMPYGNDGISCQRLRKFHHFKVIDHRFMLGFLHVLADTPTALKNRVFFFHTKMKHFD